MSEVCSGRQGPIKQQFNTLSTWREPMCVSDCASRILLLLPLFILPFLSILLWCLTRGWTPSNIISPLVYVSILRLGLEIALSLHHLDRGSCLPFFIELSETVQPFFFFVEICCFFRASVMRMTKERAPASQLLDTRITLANQSQMMTSPSSVQFSLYTPDRTH